MLLWIDLRDIGLSKWSEPYHATQRIRSVWVLLLWSAKNLIDFPQSRWVQLTYEVGEQSLKAKGRRQASGFTLSASSGEPCPRSTAPIA